jgi:hypothetical protein
MRGGAFWRRHAFFSRRFDRRRNAMRHARQPARAGAVLRGLLAIALLCASFAALGAKERHDEGVVLWQGEKEQWVRLERQDGSGTPNEHPSQIAPSDLVSFLSSLSVDEDGDVTPVFASDEAQTVSDWIARGLAQAHPDQDITFRTTGTRPLSGRLLKSAKVNSGRVFVQGGKLNLILGEVHGSYKKRSVYGQWEEDFSDLRSASRSAEEKHDWRVVVPAGVDLQTTNGTERGDWLVVATERLATVTASPTQPAPPGAGAPTAPPPVSAAPSQATVPPAAEADLERRLRAVKDLHDKGLITDDIYRAKVEEILSVL